MPAFTVELKNYERILQAFRRFPKTSEQWLQRGIIAGATELHKAATRRTVPWRTGRLVQSFGEGIMIRRLWASVRPTVRYAPYVEFGTKPHIIVPVNKRILADKKKGRIFGKIVHHPGTKPSRFIKKIIAKAQPRIEKHFEEALKKITEATGASL